MADPEGLPRFPLKLPFYLRNLHFSCTPGSVATGARALNEPHPMWSDKRIASYCSQSKVGVARFWKPPSPNPGQASIQLIHEQYIAIYKVYCRSPAVASILVELQNAVDHQSDNRRQVSEPTFYICSS